MRKIPNYDRKQKVETKRKLCDFIDEDYTMLITAQSRCGKKNTLMHMLRTQLMYYDKIYIYMPNSHQEKIQDLQSLMDKISEKIIFSILETGSADDIKDTAEYPNNNRKIVIFDDLLNAPEKLQNKIANHFTDGVIIRYPQFI